MILNNNSILVYTHMCMYIKVAVFFVFFTNRITLIYLGQSLLVLLFSLVGFNGTVNTIRSFWCVQTGVLSGNYMT